MALDLRTDLPAVHREDHSRSGRAEWVAGSSPRDEYLPASYREQRSLAKIVACQIPQQ